MASWYEKNVIPQSGFGAETEGSPMLTFVVGVAIGAVGMYAYQNREELKKHVTAPGIHKLPAHERMERRNPSANWRTSPQPPDMALLHERGPDGSLTGRWMYLNEE